MDDYIKRTDALKMKFRDGINDDGMLYVPYLDVENHLRQLPASDVRENVRGEWKNIYNYDKKMGTNYNRWMCSNCGFMARHGWEHTRAGRFPEYDFCPNCSADMRKEDKQ